MQYTTATNVYFTAAPGLWFPDEILGEGRAPGIKKRGDKSYWINVRMRLDLHHGDYRIHDLRLYTREEAGGWFGREPAIDNTVVKQLRLQDLHDGIGDSVPVLTENLPDDADLKTGFVSEESQDLDEGLRLVAYEYVKGMASGHKGAQRVADSIGVSIATAGRRIREARDAGYIWNIDQNTIDLWNTGQVGDAYGDDSSV